MNKEQYIERLEENKSILIHYFLSLSKKNRLIEIELEENKSILIHYYLSLLNPTENEEKNRLIDLFKISLQKEFNLFFETSNERIYSCINSIINYGDAKILVNIFGLRTFILASLETLTNPKMLERLKMLAIKRSIEKVEKTNNKQKEKSLKNPKTIFNEIRDLINNEQKAITKLTFK